MTFSSFDVVFLTIAFLVPGFVCDWAARKMVPRRAEGRDVLMLRFLTLSCLNYGLWIWLVYLLFRADFFRQHVWASAIIWFLITFVSPLGLGLTYGVTTQRGWLKKVFERFGVSLVHPIPTAWDYFFSTTTPVWVLVTMRDESSIAGYFGKNSFASDDPNERDLYVESIYRMTDDGSWLQVENNRGAWIRGTEIKHIGFWPTEADDV